MHCTIFLGPRLKTEYVTKPSNYDEDAQERCLLWTKYHCLLYLMAHMMDKLNHNSGGNLSCLRVERTVSKH